MRLINIMLIAREVCFLLDKEKSDIEGVLSINIPPVFLQLSIYDFSDFVLSYRMGKFVGKPFTELDKSIVNCAMIKLDKDNYKRCVIVNNMAIKCPFSSKLLCSLFLPKRITLQISTWKEKKDMQNEKLNLQRAIFVYEAARIEAKISGRRIVPEHWEKRDEAFKKQFIKVIERQCGNIKFESAGAAHDSWWREHERMGWKYGIKRDAERKIHPDMVPFNELPKDERDKDEIFIRLCAVAEAIE